FQENKMNLGSDCETPTKREGDVQLIGSLQNADAELVADAQSGSLAAFEELARRHTQLIYRTLIAILGDFADAQDGLQDTLLSAFKHIREFQGRAKFSTWLVSIARNSAL